MIEYILLGVFLLIFAVIDVKSKAIPSIFLTAILFIFIALFKDNLFYGILALVVALFLYEFEFIGGVADIKIIATIGMTINEMWLFAIFFFLITFYGTIYKFIFKWKNKNLKEIPFVPVLFIVYITITAIGGL